MRTTRDAASSDLFLPLTHSELAMEDIATPDVQEGISYWEAQPASYDGVLGGFGTGVSRVFPWVFAASFHLTQVSSTHRISRIAPISARALSGAVNGSICVQVFECTTARQTRPSSRCRGWRGSRIFRHSALPRPGRRSLGTCGAVRSRGTTKSSCRCRPIYHHRWSLTLVHLRRSFTLARPR